MVFRLEDLDPERSYAEYAELMARELRALGLDWDEGWPEDTRYAQSARTSLYEDAYADLQKRGLTYGCYCSRAQRLAASAPHLSDERDLLRCGCKDLTDEDKAALEKRGRRPAVKVTVPNETVYVSDGHYGEYCENLARGSGDFIIRRSDGVFAYQLAVCVDDAAMGITRVVRARDLLSSSPRQKWLIETLGGEAPEYCHAPLLVSPDGRKLSKREGDLNTQELLKRYTPEQLVGILAYLCGIIDRPEPVKASELVAEFSWDRVPREDIILPPWI